MYCLNVVDNITIILWPYYCFSWYHCAKYKHGLPRALLFERLDIQYIIIFWLYAILSCNGCAKLICDYESLDKQRKSVKLKPTVGAVELYKYWNNLGVVSVKR